MTIENTLENKRKFFGLYFDQKVFVDLRCPESVHTLDSTLMGWDATKSTLLLNPLSHLSQKECSVCLLLAFGPAWFSSNDINDHLPRIKKEMIEGFVMPSQICDYLRSIGYATPFMGVPVETLVEWGWVKLAEQ